ncbi:MAG: hypothetical protein GXY50_10840 [Syntrophomonadaceae bacterium]|nr:hypothetical protein [Syntrophomonadaceae bacterium]
MKKKKPRIAKIRDIGVFHLRSRKAGPQTRKKKAIKKFSVQDELSKH